MLVQVPYSNGIYRSRSICNSTAKSSQDLVAHKIVLLFFDHTWTNGRTNEGRRNGQLENIMPPPVSLEAGKRREDPTVLVNVQKKYYLTLTRLVGWLDHCFLPRLQCSPPNSKLSPNRLISISSPGTSLSQSCRRLSVYSSACKR